MSTKNQANNFLSLDIGDKRVGVARAGAIARLAEPYDTISFSDRFLGDLKRIIEKERIGLIVIGMPRNLQGEETEQTKKVKSLISRLKELKIEIDTIDEAGTSVEAERFLRQKNRPHWPNESVDSMAACIILQDYLDQG